MRLVRLGIAALFGLAALGLAACWPVSVHPIKGTASTTADPLLAGTWAGRFGDRDGRATYIHFLPQRDGTYSILTVQFGDEEAGWAHYSATSAEVAGTTYLNVRLLGSDGKAEESDFSRFFTPVRYVVTDTKLDIFMLNQEKIASLIESGALEGEVKRGQMLNDVKITAGSAELDAFLAANDPETLFTEHLVEVARVPQAR